MRRKDGSGSHYGFTPKKTADFERHVQTCAIDALNRWRRREQQKWPGNKRFALSMWFFFPDHRVRDLDNCVKSVTDALNKTVFDDDRQIDEIYAIRELDRDEPRTIVVVRPL